MLNCAGSDSADVLRITVLGGFAVYNGGRAIDQAAWRLRKARNLVKLLALAPGHALHRDQILDLLWPERDPRAATNNLHRTLHVARAALAGVSASSSLRLTGATLSLEPEVPLWIDADAFVAAAAAARHTGEAIRYQEALALYRGELLPEDRYEDWTA